MLSVRGELRARRPERQKQLDQVQDADGTVLVDVGDAAWHAGGLEEFVGQGYRYASPGADATASFE